MHSLMFPKKKKNRMTSATILLSDLRVKDERKYGMRRLLYKMSQTYAYNIFIAVGKA